MRHFSDNSVLEFIYYQLASEQIMDTLEENISDGSASSKNNNDDKNAVIIYGVRQNDKELPINLIVMAQNFLRIE